jgi:hypothetical protein
MRDSDDEIQNFNALRTFASSFDLCSLPTVLALLRKSFQKVLDRFGGFFEFKKGLNLKKVEPGIGFQIEDNSKFFLDSLNHASSQSLLIGEIGRVFD